MNPPTVGGKFAAKDVGGGVPDAPGGVKTPPYDAKDKGDTMARLRAGHARPLQGGVNELRAKARPTECGKVGCRAACPQAAADVCGNEKPCGLCCRGRRPRRPAEGSRPLPTMQTGKGDTMARLRAGHARPLRTTVNGSRTKGARGWLPLPFSPTKTKKRDGHCPVSFFLKKKEKNRTSRRRLNANGTTPLQVIPSLRIRQGALVFFLFNCRSEALAFDVLIVHYFCRICKMRACTTCYIYPTLFCIVCTTVHG